jgi:hypothetical protein
LKKSTIGVAEPVIKFDPPPTMAPPDAATVVAVDPDFVPESTIVPVALPVAAAMGPYTADWATDELVAEPPHVPPPSLEPDYLELAKQRGLMRKKDERKTPPWTFFSGVFSFPWRLGNIARWATMAVGLTITGELLLLAAAQIAGRMGTGTLLLPILSLVGAGMTLVTLSFTAACFLAAVDDTSDGHDDPQEATLPALDGWFFSFFSVLGIWLISGALGYPLALVPALGPPAILASSIILFPILLLSAMECDSFFLPWSALIWKSLARLPGMWLAFYLVSTAVLAGWFIPTAVAISVAPFVVMLVAGPALAAVILIYARLVGRLAWRITIVMAPAVDAKPPTDSTGHPRPDSRKASKKRKRAGRRIQVQIPDEAKPAPGTQADRPMVPRPRLDFHKRP